jgi:hypothetical protein
VFEMHVWFNSLLGSFTAIWLSMSQELEWLLLIFFILDGLIVSELDIFFNISLHRSNRKLVEIIIMVLKALSQRDCESRYCGGSKKHHKTARGRKGLLSIVCIRVSFLVVT